jgi:hypothetical protein
MRHALIAIFVNILSLRMRAARTITNTILSLSIGATVEALPTLKATE